MFASIEYRSQIELRINHEGKSVVIATLQDINVAREMCDNMNQHCKFSPEIFKGRK